MLHGRSAFAHLRPRALPPRGRSAESAVRNGLDRLVSGVQHRVLQTAVLEPHPVHPLFVMQMSPRPWALQSASVTQCPASEQKTSSAQ
jgi:hypothetical protein